MDGTSPTFGRMHPIEEDSDCRDKSSYSTNNSENDEKVRKSFIHPSQQK